MALDKWVAVFFLVVCLIYGYAAFTYPLLPFERNMSFLPNTMPMVLAVLGVGLAVIILVSPKPKDDGEDVLGSIDLRKWREYKVGQALGLIVAMIAYAISLAPVGFLPSTVAFLVGAGAILGERAFLKMILIAAIGASVIWYIVQEALGIFLRPLPAFLMQGG